MRPPAALPALLRPFDRPIRHLAPVSDPDDWQRWVGVLRIVFAAVLIHQQVNNLGLLETLPPDLAAQPSVLATVGLAGLVLVGLLTPLALAGLIAVTAYYPPVFYLGSWMTVLVGWALLMLGGGRAVSVDRVLAARLSLYRRLVGWHPAPTAAAVAGVRLGVLTLFWGVCLSALSFHLWDPLWQDRTCLHLLFTSPFLCDHARTFERVRAAAPQAFDATLQMVVLVQEFWEAFLLPCLWTRAGVRFVRIQGWLFLGGCLVLMNLAYLAPYELILWALVFIDRTPGRPRGTTVLPASGTADRQSPASAAFVAGSIVVVTSFQLTSPMWGNLESPAAVSYRWPGVFTDTWHTRYVRRGIYPLFGQGFVDVFNSRDFNSIGHEWFVVCELDEHGRPFRVVPYLDADCGRLAYLRNDLLYFRLTLIWQRAANAGPGVPRVTREREVYHAVAELDARFKPNRGHVYRGYLFARSYSRQEDGAVRWDPPAFCGVLPDYTVPPTGRERPWPRPFTLPPGHVGQGERRRQTLGMLQALEVARPKPDLRTSD